VAGSGPGHRRHDRIEVAVDAELGIMLRRIETAQGELLTRTELTDLTMNPPEAADPARFAPPPGSNRSEHPDLGLPEWLTEPDGNTAKKNAVSLAAGGLGATLRQWQDMAAMSEAFDEVRTAAPGGVRYLLDAVTRWQTVTRTQARLRVSGPDRYRLEYSSRPDQLMPRLTVCDGERRWRIVQDRIVVGPAAPLREHGAFLADSSWLLRGRLSGGAELTYRGRPARQLRVTHAPGDEKTVLGPLILFPANAIADAETGCLLRLIAYAGDTLARWSELDDISTEPAGPDEFQVHVPPGSRTVEETGNLVADNLAAMPGPTGTAVRAAAEAVTRTTAAVSAARGFLDDLRGRPRPPRPPRPPS
jgi:outer membrane lipoprotein-sorting protein